MASCCPNTMALGVSFRNLKALTKTEYCVWHPRQDCIRRTIAVRQRQRSTEAADGLVKRLSKAKATLQSWLRISKGSVGSKPGNGEHGTGHAPRTASRRPRSRRLLPAAAAPTPRTARSSCRRPSAKQESDTEPTCIGSLSAKRLKSRGRKPDCPATRTRATTKTCLALTWTGKLKLARPTLYTISPPAS